MRPSCKAHEATEWQRHFEPRATPHAAGGPHLRFFTSEVGDYAGRQVDIVGTLIAQGETGASVSRKTAGDLKTCFDIEGHPTAVGFMIDAYGRVGDKPPRRVAEPGNIGVDVGEADSSSVARAPRYPMFQSWGEGEGR